jgi:quinol-cytochrome oxidoreductase complex cytochrome b subunit
MRYIVLLMLNVPIISVALLNLVTKYKMKKISKKRFNLQMLLWAVLLTILIFSFPIYNITAGKPPLDSHELSLFDIIQTTAVIFMVFVINNMRQKIESTERTLKELHQELSIRTSNQ